MGKISKSFDECTYIITVEKYDKKSHKKGILQIKYKIILAGAFIQEQERGCKSKAVKNTYCDFIFEIYWNRDCIKPDKWIPIFKQSSGARSRYPYLVYKVKS